MLCMLCEILTDGCFGDNKQVRETLLFSNGYRRRPVPLIEGSTFDKITRKRCSGFDEVACLVD